MRLRSMLDIIVSRGKLKLLHAEYFADVEFDKGDVGCSPVQMGNVPPTFPLLP